MTPIRALLFDLDETLIKDRASTIHSLNAVVPKMLEHVPTLTHDQIRAVFVKTNNWHWENFDESPISKMNDPLETRSFLWSLALKELGVEANGLANELGQIYQDARHDSFEPYEDVAEFLPVLRERYALYLVTNGNRLMQRRKLETTGLTGGWEGIFIAQEQGVSKPKPQYFQRVLKAAKASPDECLMIGDNLNADIQGGINAGIKTVWMKRRDDMPEHPEVKPDHTVQNLKELVELLDNQYV
ncbi:MAG: HAD family hydrolase [Candidatus Hinthialibacter antarcticus]|nr:HAD family hydrolase [Candidatus Hinthialibacter antarcticus]